MENGHDQTSEAMMGDGEDSGIASNDSGSRRDSLSSLPSMASNDPGSRRDSLSSTASNDSGIGSMSNASSTMSGLIHIQVVDYEGKTKIATVRPTDTVKDLKVKIQEKLKIAPSQQRLQFQSKTLDDQSTSSLKSLGLQHLSTVHLHGRLQGGAA